MLMVVEDRAASFTVNLGTATGVLLSVSALSPLNWEYHETDRVRGHSSMC